MMSCSTSVVTNANFSSVAESPSNDAELESYDYADTLRRSKRKCSIESTYSICESLAASPPLEEYSGAVGDENSFVEPSPRPQRKSTRLLKRISSTTSFDLNILSRKRKRKDVDDDNISIQSLSVHSNMADPNNGMSTIDRKTRRRPSMKKMSSLVNMLSPANNRVGKALERSFSFKSSGSPVATTITARQITPYKKPKPAANSERRASKFWSETVDQKTRSTFSSQEIKRQEAIYELVQGEKDLIEDLTMVHKLYYNSMKKLKLMTEQELDSIFGTVARLVPFHEDLLKQLESLKTTDGSIDSLGESLLSWVPNLRQYETYCANQVFAKGLLDYKKSDPKVEDFLNRCQESSFSRKLDLWNFLDLPRSRLVKYPLLLKQILKQTDESHSDKEKLSEIVEHVETIIKDVDAKMGESKCRYAIQNLEYSFDSQKSDLIEQSTAVVCSGQLKNDRGTKLYVFLFDKVLVVTRQATRNNILKYQVVKEPIPLSDLELCNLTETESKRGSFKKKVLGHSSSDKCAFRITDLRPDGSSHTLHTKEEHDKRQWMNCIQKAVARESNSLNITSHLVFSDNTSVGSGHSIDSSSLSASNSTSNPETDSIPEETAASLKQETVV